MNRTEKLKIGYAIALVVPFLLALWLYAYAGLNSAILIGVVLILLVFGRITGWLWRDILIGRRKMDAQQYEEAIPYLESFLNKLEMRPWIGNLIWISPTLYTINAKAMALNNLGACYLELDNRDDAMRHFASALEQDPLYPLPHYNLALIAGIEDATDTMQEHLAKSVLLGYAAGAFDHTLDRIKSAYARYEPTA